MSYMCQTCKARDSDSVYNPCASCICNEYDFYKGQRRMNYREDFEKAQEVFKDRKDEDYIW